MQTSGRTCAILAAFLLTTEARAQVDIAVERADIENSSRYTLKSTHTGSTYVVDVLRVASAFNPPNPDYPLPVIYVLDGNSLFPMVSQMAAVSVPFSSGIPAVLVVSIGYAADPSLTRAQTITNRNAWRTRDYLPALTSGKPPAGLDTAGGAANFLAFIEEELKPFVAARYSVNVDDQTLAGHSAGGLFAVYALLNSPSSFLRYLAISPSLQWDDRRLINQATGFSFRGTGPPRRLAVVVGERETKERMGADMIGNAAALASALQNQNDAGLEVTYYLFPDEDHLSVVPGALRRGLRAVGALP